MLLHLCFLLTGCVCHGSADVPTVTVLQSAVATLPCPHAQGRITWSRWSATGEKVILVSVENGIEQRDDRRYGSLADGSLVITGVTPADTTMYLCNDRKTAYLEVTTDANMVAPKAGHVPATPRDAGRGFGQTGVSAGAWKVPVGVVVGAATLVLLAAVTLRLCLKRRADRSTDSGKAVTHEGIYEEIRAGEEPPSGEPAVESPYYWTSVCETPRGSTAADDNLYSTVSQLRTKGRRHQECVYYLAQNPPQAGNTSDRPLLSVGASGSAAEQTLESFPR